MKHIYLISVFVCFTTVCSAQKIKYKDLFVLLSAENYNDGGPYLKRFLVTEPSHPNANYQMGKMLQTSMNEADVLKETEKIAYLADSSILFFEKAKSLITAKDVKKHAKNYYAAFKRRDIRSGKFEVKLSDLQLDIDGRIEQINKRKENVGVLAGLFAAAQFQYDTCQQVYKDLREKNSSQPVLYLSTTDDQLYHLSQLVEEFKSCYDNLTEYTNVLAELGNTGYKQTMELRNIEDFKTEGTSTTDFYGETIELWDYGTWANSVSDVVKKQIIPLRKRMVDYDDRLDELLVAIKQDSLDVRSQVFKLATENVARDIRDFDAHSSVAVLFNFKIAEINYLSSVFNWINVVQDSANVGLKITTMDDLHKQLSGLNKIGSNLKSFDSEEEYHKYAHFIEARYDSLDRYRLMISGIEIFLAQESNSLDKWSKMVTVQDQQTIWKQDTISIVAGDKIVDNATSTTYYTFAVDSTSERIREFAGIRQPTSDSLYFFFGVSPSSRVTDTIYTAPLIPSLAVVSIAELSHVHDPAGEIRTVWIIGHEVDTVYSGQVILIDKLAGIVWNASVQFENRPTGITFTEASKLFHILLGDNTEDVLINNFGEVVEEESTEIVELKKEGSSVESDTTVNQSSNNKN